MIEKEKNFYSKFKLQPVILSGGTGSRLWPLSRESFPKQYLNLDDNSNFSLLQNTYLRLKGLKNLEAPIIICNEEQRFIVAEQMREIEIEPKSIILEPIGRNTAPAIAISSLLAIRNNCDPILLILSSDHLIEDSLKFQQMIAEGIKHAEKGRLVTFGILPTSPETGYGYIESFDALSNENKSSNIKKFIEKPNRKIVKELIKDSHYSWNSGIFLFKASSILSELGKFQPQLLELCSKCLSESKMDLNFTRINKKYFAKCSNIPIDIAVMEKTNLGTVIKFECLWKDLGSWESVWESSKKDKEGNTLKGRVFNRDSKNCYFRSEHRLIVGLGIKDLIIIETNDSILVANKKSTQSVKDVVIDLKENNFAEGKTNKKVHRPWGNYISIEENSTWQVKRLEIKPKSSLSLQLHKHRAEHWVVVAGTAHVEIESQRKILKTNESIFVPLGSKHRLSNESDTLLIIIEVQSGNYLGEDDIIRFSDIYGRTDQKLSFEMDKEI